MSKFYCFDHYDDITLRNKQIIFLYEHLEVDIYDIAKVVGLTPSTIKNYVRKYSYYYDEVKTLFTEKPSKNSNAVFIPVKNVEFSETRNTEKFYLLEIRNTITNELIASKVGTTIRPMRERMSEHKRYYTDSYGTEVTIEVKRVYNCGTIPAECYESYFRAYYIVKHLGHFVKNDRFANVTFDYEEIDNLLKKMKKDLGI